MRHLVKSEQSEILTKGLKYKDGNSYNNAKIRAILIAEQGGFCAYTEKYIDSITSVDVEHFNDRLKNTDEDNYYNWYAVLHWLNNRKVSINSYLPILHPYENASQKRVHYQNGVYQVVNAGDTEAQNLIDFLQLNRYELHHERMNGIKRVKYLLEILGGIDQLKTYLQIDQSSLSFFTALEAELDLDLSDLI